MWHEFSTRNISLWDEAIFNFNAKRCRKTSKRVEYVHSRLIFRTILSFLFRVLYFLLLLSSENWMAPHTWNVSAFRKKRARPKSSIFRWVIVVIAFHVTRQLTMKEKKNWWKPFRVWILFDLFLSISATEFSTNHRL